MLSLLTFLLLAEISQRSTSWDNVIPLEIYRTIFFYLGAMRLMFFETASSNKWLILLPSLQHSLLGTVGAHIDF